MKMYSALATYVLCKPTHFFLKSFKAAMSNSLQESSNRVMKDWPDKYHVPSRGNLQGQIYLKVFLLFYHIPYKDGMHMTLEMY